MNKKKRNIIIGVVAAVVVIFAVVFAIFAITPPTQSEPIIFASL